MRRRHATARGFTLVELMVAMSLAGLLIAGAFQIHAVFTSQGQRQQQLADVQQSLRVSMQVIERAVRGAGAGMSNGKMVISPNCAGGITSFYRAQFYNSNVWPPAAAPGAYDTVAGDVDGDPDILRVISAVDAGVTLAASGSTAVLSDIHGPTAGWLVNDFLVFVNSSTATATTATGCMRQITGLGAALPVLGVPTQKIGHVSPGLYNCVNTDLACLSTVTYPTPVRHFRNQIYFRVIPPVNATDTAKLVMTTAPIGDAPVQPVWSVIADDVEDMQIALMMADGRICNDRDDPSLATPTTTCEPSQASALRVTLVGRTLSRVPGNPKSFGGGYEDSQSVQVTDGRLRRALTAEISLRN